MIVLSLLQPLLSAGVLSAWNDGAASKSRVAFVFPFGQGRKENWSIHDCALCCLWLRVCRADFNFLPVQSRGMPHACIHGVDLKLLLAYLILMGQQSGVACVGYARVRGAEMHICNQNQHCTSLFFFFRVIIDRPCLKLFQKHHKTVIGVSNAWSHLGASNFWWPLGNGVSKQSKNLFSRFLDHAFFTCVSVCTCACLTFACVCAFCIGWT